MKPRPCRCKETARLIAEARAEEREKFRALVMKHFGKDFGGVQLLEDFDRDSRD